MEAGGQIYGRKKYILNNLIYTTACWLARGSAKYCEREKKVKFPKIGSTSDQYVSCIGTIFSFPVIMLSKRGREKERGK